MRILLTGISGFVGACLTRRLLELGHDVHAFIRPESSRWRIADILSDIAQYGADIRDTQAVEQAVKSIKPEVVFHLATYGGFAFQKDVSAIYAANLLGTVNLVHACKKTGFDCFVNTGSSSEYGLKFQAMKETDLLEPLGDYAVSKAAATLFCRSEAILNNLPIVNLRVFSPYGPLDDPKRMIPYVISTLLNGGLPALSNPDSVRDYIFIDDLVDAYLAVIGSAIQPGAIYNAGSGQQKSIGDVVAKIIACLDSSISPLWGSREMQRPEPDNWVADIMLLKSHCNWQPRTGLESGLNKTIDWIRLNLPNYLN
jgi:nucleoside-diphosphate-sugar epimerase